MKIPGVKRSSKEVLARVHSLEGGKRMFAMIEPETGEWNFFLQLVFYYLWILKRKGLNC